MSEIVSTTNVKAVFSRSKCLIDETTIEMALQKMASEINRDLKEENPIVLCVLIAGVVLTGKLLTLIDFPLQLDYIHATRYGDNTVGTQLKWIVKPRASMVGRTVLIVDDILDHGITLAGIIDYCYSQGATSVKTAVLVEKDIVRPQNTIQKADYTGVTVENRYVFGYGMDYKGYLRNAKGIFAVSKEDE